MSGSHPGIDDAERTVMAIASGELGERRVDGWAREVADGPHVLLER